MKALLTLLILLSAGFAVAQEPAPAPEPEYTITILVVDPTGKTEFSQSAVLPASLMGQMVAACEIEAGKQNLGTTNPAYDQSKPITDTNQPVLPVKGAAAVAGFIKWFLGAVTEANAGTIEAQQLAAQRKEVVRDKIGQVKIRDNKPATEPRK